ncbi:MAG: glycosyl hydrolase family protein, partial [Chitinophagaceae bacterium]
MAERRITNTRRLSRKDTGNCRPYSKASRCQIISLMAHHKDFSASLFGPNFKWGVATSAFQTEGGWNADGKGVSIWDDFTSRKGAIMNSEHAKTACDHYNRFKEDIQIVKNLGIPCYRFSISWTRILPSGTGCINPAGITFYNKIIDYCLELGIEPWATLYHWDLPHKLEQHGGWGNRRIINWFENYTQICIHHFGDRVKNWMVVNEPLAFIGAGYFLGVHAPGKRGLRNFLPAVHHANLAIAQSAKAIKALNSGLRVGTTFSCALIEPASSSEWDIRAADRVDALVNRLFVEPLTGIGYPFSSLGFLTKIQKYMLPGDADLLSFN